MAPKTPLRKYLLFAFATLAILIALLVPLLAPSWSRNHIIIINDSGRDIGEIRFDLNDALVMCGPPILS